MSLHNDSIQVLAVNSDGVVAAGSDDAKVHCTVTLFAAYNSSVGPSSDCFNLPFATDN